MQSSRVSRLTIAISQLPLLERLRWQAALLRVAARHQQQRARAVQVAGDDETQTEWDLQIANMLDPARGDTPNLPSQSEWDLQVANWLDNAYSIVSDRVEEVAKKGAATVRTATSLSFVPVLLGVGALVAIGYAAKGVRS